MADYRRELVELYECYNPAKLKDVDRLLITFKGREDIMLDTLRKKYALQEGTEKAPVRSAVASDPNMRANSSATFTPSRLDDEHQVLSSRSAHMRPHATPSEAGEDHHDAVVAVPADLSPTNRMHQLVAQMSAVDLEALVEQISGLVESGSGGRLARGGQTTVQAELFVHLLKFMRFFVACAKEFLTLAQQERDATEAHRARGSDTSKAREPSSPPPRLLGGATTTAARASHSPPASRARTKTPVSPDHQPPDVVTTPAFVLPPPPAPHQQSLTPLRPATVGGARTFTLSPAAPSNGAVSVFASTRGLLPLQPGDTILLEPGHYTENITFSGEGPLVIRAALPGTPVTLRAQHTTEPVLRVKGTKAEVAVTGVVLVGDRLTQESSTALTADGATQYLADASLAAVPLVAASHGARVSLSGCHLYRCGTAAVTAVGPCTRIELHLCLISLCAFAGVYAHRGGAMELSRCRIKCCEVGVRAGSGESVVHMVETTVENCATDGVVLHQASTARMERCSVFNNKSNGALVAAGGSLEVVDSTIELNLLYGVQRFRGSHLHLRNSFIRDNGLLPVNDVET